LPKKFRSFNLHIFNIINLFKKYLFYGINGTAIFSISLRPPLHRLYRRRKAEKKNRKKYANNFI
jgi:hypothetical protein